MKLKNQMNSARNGVEMRAPARLTELEKRFIG